VNEWIFFIEDWCDPVKKRHFCAIYI